LVCVSIAVVFIFIEQIEYNYLKMIDEYEEKAKKLNKFKTSFISNSVSVMSSEKSKFNLTLTVTINNYTF
jgi:hypothetical protein